MSAQHVRFYCLFSSIISLHVLYLDDGVLVAPHLPHPQSYFSCLSYGPDANMELSL